ncbi:MULTISPECIES: ASCH domain-containing protein [Roseomonadaceae]|uniref:ASCH domain-containing protein n=1 Tax=Falsiroseomonas oleicola TaxID=2801474 RepID=A0ABS6H615_9PROT|nr:ASCH domain-containing protein [Roseomonas oleicola]MBU8544130.1 ASCH domain-containing protein [Roseomonas oleicola]
MRALSVVRPGGSLIAAGQKTLEVRRWAPELSPTDDLLIVENGRFLRQDGDEDPNGMAVAVVRVKAIRPFIAADMTAACASFFEEGWLAWELSNLRPLPPGRRLRAARRIYEVDFTP